MKRFRIWEMAALTALCVSLLAGTWAQSRQQTLSRGLIRLHVVAVSDEEEEQALKLRVRDGVLDYLRPLLEGVTETERARTVLEENLEGIAEAARARAEGRTVRVSLEKERFPLRRYQGFALPAGEYESLRISLGEGKGHNWWCVVFPPLCQEAISPEQAKSVMGVEGYAIISQEEGYELRFRVLELWGELCGLLTAK